MSLPRIEDFVKLYLKPIHAVSLHIEPLFVKTDLGNSDRKLRLQLND